MRLRREKDVPELNTTSTADISFMLLVFFLVTTSMFVDKGLSRQLPPKDKEKEQQKEVMVEKENILAVRLDSAGIVFFNDSVVVPANFTTHLADFIMARGKEHIVSIDASEECPYESYFVLQNALSEAYVQVRERISQKQYKRSFAELTSIDRERVLEQCPQRLAENYHNRGGRQ